MSAASAATELGGRFSHTGHERRRACCCSPSPPLAGEKVPKADEGALLLTQAADESAAPAAPASKTSRQPGLGRLRRPSPQPSPPLAGERGRRRACCCSPSPPLAGEKVPKADEGALLLTQAADESAPDGSNFEKRPGSLAWVGSGAPSPQPSPPLAGERERRRACCSVNTAASRSKSSTSRDVALNDAPARPSMAGREAKARHAASGLTNAILGATSRSVMPRPGHPWPGVRPREPMARPGCFGVQRCHPWRDIALGEPPARPSMAGREAKARHAALWLHPLGWCLVWRCWRCWRATRV
jgi:hypothetical protein